MCSELRGSQRGLGEYEKPFREHWSRMEKIEFEYGTSGAMFSPGDLKPKSENTWRRVENGQVF